MGFTPGWSKVGPAPQNVTVQGRMRGWFISADLGDSEVFVTG